MVKRPAVTAAAVTALLGGALATAPAAQADDGDDCRGGYALFDSDEGSGQRERLHIFDTLKDHRGVLVRVDARGYHRSFVNTRGAGTGVHRTLHIREHRLAEFRIYLFKDSRYVKCGAFKDRA